SVSLVHVGRDTNASGDACSTNANPMSAPSQFGPPPQKPRSGSGGTLLFVALGVAAVSLVCCGGICAGGLLLFTTRTTTLEKVQSAIQDQLPAPLVAPR